MELVGATYLYTLATISITFVGFTTLFMILRQLLGGPMSKFDIMVTRSFLQLGFMGVVGSLLPPLINLFSRQEQIVWRLASILAAIPPLLFALTYPRRRFAATGMRMPKIIWFNLSLLYVSVGAFLLNTLGKPFTPGPALFALGVTVIIFGSFLAFFRALQALLAQPTGASLDKKE